MIEAAIFNRLSTYAGTSALVCTVGQKRVYPDLLPQNPTYPAITYERTNTKRPKTLGGFYGKARGQFRFNCWHTNPTTAANLRSQVVQALEGMNGTYASCVVSGVNFINEWDDWEPDVRIARKMVDVEIWYVEE